MKRTLLSALVLVMFGLTSTAFAAPKAPKGPPAKAAILHCGCTADGLGMEYKLISVSSKAKGHANHDVGSIDSCSPDGINYTDFVRTGADCQVSGPAINGVGACTTELEFDPCGAPAGP